MGVKIKVAGPEEEHLLQRIVPGVFDRRVDPERATEFLRDPRHHLVVGLDGEEVVGFASAVHYIHPDKPPELWINEIGVATSHRRQGIGMRLLRALLDEGRRLNCRAAWVLTEQSNVPALNLYTAAGGRRTDQAMFTFQLAD